MITQQKFPKDFMWGASTAAHQVEGGNVNQWSAWELANAVELAKTAERRLSWTHEWAKIKDQATTPENYVSGDGVDHYHKYAQDFDIVKKLQMNSFRFGIEWSRLEPEEGIWNEAAIKHYHEYIDALHERGIEPILTIWHWTVPVWFADRGGFARKENLTHFDRFVQKVAEEYGDKLRYVITLNEPNVFASFSYGTGEWPPQQQSWKTAARVYWNLTRAHRRAFAILKAADGALQVGVAAQLANIQAKRPHNLIDGATTKVMRYAWNWWFLNRIRAHQDFIGLNYYFTDYYQGIGERKNPRVPLSDLNWYMEPEGLYPLLLRTWNRYKLPIIIVENGVADADDAYRQWWLEQTMVAMQRALSEGVKLRGYLHWSLLDNFEWKYGWWPKFGLIAVDREHGMKRTPRPSAVWLAKYLRALRDNDEREEARRTKARAMPEEAAAPPPPAKKQRPPAPATAAPAARRIRKRRIE